MTYLTAFERECKYINYISFLHIIFQYLDTTIVRNVLKNFKVMQLIWAKTLV